ncbi:MAG TPA: right-handed parallel beta-helix repeat-containing protein [Bryobacteraceae bacterium]|nr:right-handed parallel beta-helix repeat-containing protein [Bryobacteraceae bacterium]
MVRAKWGRLSTGCGRLILILFTFSACAPRPPDFFRRTGIVELPAGTLILHREITLPEHAHNLEIRGSPSGSTLEAAPDFEGRALIYSKGAIDLRLTGFRIVGHRSALQKPIGLAPSNVLFARYYRNNGIVVENATRLLIRRVSFSEVANYPVLVSASSGVRIDNVRIDDCGSLAPSGRNNASGGILLEEGTRDFEVRQCVIRRVRGNAIWTHSNYRSPRNANGTIQENFVEEVARDAIQVGHATNIAVRGNRGRRIGYPPDLVDAVNWAVPVAIDTGGNVDRSIYAGNHFEDINGKCMDLDGFHDGEIRDNSCISRKPPDQYPDAQYGIVFNNSNPDYQPSNVLVTGNLIDGAGYGGLCLLGSHQVVTGNRFLGLNRNRCTSDRTRPRCDYSAGDPALLRAGIYLVPGAARPAKTEHNRIAGNEVSGFGMRQYCIVAAPGVSMAANSIAGNRCLDSGTPAASQ